MDWEDYNDKELNSLEKKLKHVYQHAYKEMQETVDDYFAKFAEDDEQMRKDVQDGKITNGYYQTWRRNTMATGKHWATMRDNIAKKLNELNKEAEKDINSASIKAYVDNYNYTQFEGSVETGISFELTNENAVEHALKSNHTLFKTVNINNTKDINIANKGYLMSLQVVLYRGRHGDN